MVNCILISAKGESTFSVSQIKRLQEKARVTFCKQVDEISADELINMLYPYEYVGITRRPIKDINARILDGLPNLKGMAIFSTGYEWIDVEHAKQKGIAISYLPEYSTASVAEHTMGLLLSALRRIHISYDYSRNLVDKTISMRGFELEGKKIGIVGFGRIGQKVHCMLRGFGVTITYHDIDGDIIRQFPETFEDKGSLLGTCDIIILCASKERGSDYIIRDKEIEYMKDGVIIINPAKKDLVDNHAIWRGIKSKKIFTYAVDEKIDLFADKNMEVGRILQTGHTAWYSTEAIERGTEQWINNLLSLMNKEPINLV